VPYCLQGICFVDSLYGWAVGDQSTIIKTSNGGQTWRELKSPYNTLFHEVYFFDRDRGWIIGGGDEGGYYGVILITTNGGENWIVKSPFIQHGPIYDMSFVSAKTGYIAGPYRIIKTTNGGINWTDLTNTGSASTVFFIDSLTGWYGNVEGDIFKTADGGQNWTHLKNLFWHWHKEIRFVSPKTGWIISKGLYDNYSTIYKTVDGGNSWYLQDSVIFADYKEIEVIDSLNAWIVGENGQIRYTEDGGQLWFYLSTGHTEDFFDISFQGKRRWIAGGTWKYPILLSSQEFLHQWTLHSKNLTPNNFSEIAFFDSSIGWVAGEQGGLFKTIDGGESWQKISLFSVNFTSLAVPSSSHIYLVSETGEFVKSTDGGNSWSISQIQYPYDEYKLHFFSEKTGYCSGKFLNRLIKTTDGGNSWTELGNYLNGSFFADSLNGWVYFNPLFETQNSTLICTNDGGLTWKDTVEVEGIINTLFFLDPSNGWYSSGYDLYHSTDGGLHWNMVLPWTDFQIKQIYFLNDNEGFFLADKQYSTSLYQTVDGGFTYQEIKSNTYLTYLNLTNRRFGWAAGNNGQILKFDTIVLGIKEFPGAVNIKNFKLEQNFPNPFNSTTIIRYFINTSADVSLKIYDILGREVAVLVQARQSAGNHEVPFEGNSLSSGLYLYRLQVNEKSETRKLLLLK
jgi:photosystem II stability/assembly factor-like uncharacterized protein